MTDSSNPRFKQVGKKVASKLKAKVKRPRRNVTLSLDKENWEWLFETAERGEASAVVDALIAALREEMEGDPPA